MFSWQLVEKANRNESSANFMDYSDDGISHHCISYRYLYDGRLPVHLYTWANQEDEASVVETSITQKDDSAKTTGKALFLRLLVLIEILIQEK